MVSWNAGAQRIKGYRPEEILSRHFSVFFPPEDAKAGKPRYELAVAAERGRFEDEGWRVRKDGSRFWASVVMTALHDEAGQLRGFAKVTRDITERKKTEEALRDSESRLTLALDSAQMGVWDVDLKSGKIVRSLRNDQIFGYPSLQSDWTMSILLSHVLPEDREMVKTKLAEATYTGHFRIECRILWPNRSVRWIALRGRVHRNEYGGPTRMMGVVVDITELSSRRRMISSCARQSWKRRTRNSKRSAIPSLTICALRFGQLTDSARRSWKSVPIVSTISARIT